MAVRGQRSGAPGVQHDELGPVAVSVRNLYDDVGWATTGGLTVDARTSEDLRPEARAYVSACRMRVKRHLPERGQRLLDIGSGPIQYPEYLTYSDGFNVRTCIDLSAKALADARTKLGDAGEYLLGDFLSLDVPSADAAVCLHAIYHIDAAHQEQAVRKLIRCIKPHGVAVIVYSNPAYPVSRILGPVRRIFERRKPDLYMHRFPLRWWDRFENEAKVEIHPWRTFPTREQCLIGKRGLRVLFWLEDRFPRLFSKWGCYPMIVLRRFKGYGDSLLNS